MRSANEIYKKMRLDLLLVERGLAPSRSRAADLVRLGAVSVEGKTVEKPGMLLSPDAELAVDPSAFPYVSRGGLKLRAALDAFGLDPKGLIALDLGTSTGGFTEVLLERGAAKVVAVDVGHGQLHAKLRADPRVTLLEGTDARSLDARMVAGPVGAIVVDLSFISLLKALPPVLRLAAPGAWLVALVKPQFEAGRESIGKGGIVRDEAARAEAVARVRDFVEASPDWTVIGEMPSPIHGADGNIEILLGLVWSLSPSR
jgi:23S rRNA (cytidine1920-2'-O)/16S rRNA (cytidine1409-2'-O)-methyltransferase